VIYDPKTGRQLGWYDEAGNWMGRPEDEPGKAKPASPGLPPGLPAFSGEKPADFDQRMADAGIRQPTTPAPGAKPTLNYNPTITPDRLGDVNARAAGAIDTGRQGFDQLAGQVGQAGDQARQEGGAAVDEFDAATGSLLGEAMPRILSRYDPVLEAINNLPTDPSSIYDRMLSTQLAQAQSVQGGVAAQRGAAAQALKGAPAVYAQAEEQARANQVERANLLARAAESLNDDDLSLVQQSLNAAESIMATDSQLAQFAAQLDSTEQMQFGALMLELQNIYMQNEAQFAAMNVEEQIAFLNAKVQEYGIDQQLSGIMAQIRAGGRITARDVFSGFLGLAAAGVQAAGGA
jgi:hypothetical protein